MGQHAAFSADLFAFGHCSISRSWGRSGSGFEYIGFIGVQATGTRRPVTEHDQTRVARGLASSIVARAQRIAGGHDSPPSVTACCVANGGL